MNLQLSQHKKVYARFHSPNKNEGAARKCTRKIREQGKQDIRAQIIDMESHWWDDYYHDDYIECCYYNLCSSCKIETLKSFGYDIKIEGPKQVFLENLISATSKYFWDYDSITFDEIIVQDIEAFFAFHLKYDSVHPVEWLIHPDAGIRTLASRKYAGR